MFTHFAISKRVFVYIERCGLCEKNNKISLKSTKKTVDNPVDIVDNLHNYFYELGFM